MKFWREQGNSAYQVEEIRQGDPYREEGHLEEEDHPFQDQVGKGAHLGDPSYQEEEGKVVFLHILSLFTLIRLGGLWMLTEGGSAWRETHWRATTESWWRP